ncbi:MAG: hypothetical protein C4346_10540 [Chloroflexota bacterium]
MEVLAAFVAGYLLGLRHGQDRFDQLAEAVQTIVRSPEVRGLSTAAVSLVAQRMGERSWMLGVAGDLAKDALTRLLTPRR